MQTRRLLPLLAVLAFIAYQPVLTFPFISDNYTDIPLSIGYASWHGLRALFANPAFHFRLSYIFANASIAGLFGFTPKPFYIASIVFHILCVWVVWSTGAWKKIGWKASTWAAGFFAVYEGHQEAVMWVAAWPEMFLVLFGCGCFLCWVLWLQGGRWWLYALACVLFVAALFSRESAYIWAPLLALPVVADRRLWRRGLRGIMPFAAVAAGYIFAVATGLKNNPRAHNSSFVLSPAMPWHLINSFGHMLFVWGLLALLFLIVIRARETLGPVGISIGWMLIALIPYSFLTDNRVPSRQTYLASVGLALLVGIALAKMQDRFSVRWAAAAACIIVMVNVGLLWTKKRREYLERAQPTDLLIQAVPEAKSPIHVSCFPYAPVIAGAAVEYAGGQVVLDRSSQPIEKPHCLSFSYKDAFGNVHQTTVHTAI